MVGHRCIHQHILLAEDDPSNRKVTQLILKRLGYDVDAVSNGFEVLQSLESRRYDLILMDLMMPGMDGFTAAREIRSRGREQPVIIAVTAYILPDGRQMCLEAGMDDYIIKPVRKEELSAVLKRHMPGGCRNPSTAT